MGRSLRSVNTLNLDRATNTFSVDTLEGDGRGSRITMTLKQVQGGTEISYPATMELGPLGFFAKGPAKSQFEKTVNEDMASLDAMA